MDFAEIEGMQAAGAWHQVGELLAEVAAGLEAGGAELLLLVHQHDAQGRRPGARRCHDPAAAFGDVTAHAVNRAGLRTVGLLGTAFTMEQDFYRARLASHGLTVLILSEPDRAEIHRIIYDELCLGVVRPQSRESYRDVIKALVRAGAEGIVLGCTEIELLLSVADSPVPIFPTTRLHVEAAVAAALEPDI